MNERIKELAEQCYEKHELLGTYQFNKEKFAELIIQECAKIADRYADENLRLLPSQEMKKKFGL